MQQKINSAMRNGLKRIHVDGDKTYIVYMHVFPNNKKYIGITGQSLNARWKNGLGYNGSSLQNEIIQQGWENLRHYILFQSDDYKKAKEIYTYYIDKLKTFDSDYGYNVNDTTHLKASECHAPNYETIEVDGKGKRR